MRERPAGQKEARSPPPAHYFGSREGGKGYGGLRIGSWLNDTGYVIYLVARSAAPITMALWGWALYRINNVYLDLTRQERRQEPAAVGCRCGGGVRCVGRSS